MHSDKMNVELSFDNFTLIVEVYFAYNYDFHHALLK